MGYKKLDMSKVEDAVRNLLTALGEDVNREGLKETPKRVAKAYAELLEGEDYTNEQIGKMFQKNFEVGYESVVIVECRNIWSICEHHVLLFNGEIFVSYLPVKANPDDPESPYKILGLSKIPRIVEMCSRRLQLQEKLNADIAECIQIATGSKQVYVRSIMKHGCVSARGAKSDSRTDATYMTADLRRDPEMRKEIESKIQELHLSSIR